MLLEDRNDLFLAEPALLHPRLLSTESNSNRGTLRGNVSSNSTRCRLKFDHVLMLKVLMLQAMHSLPDERCEHLLKNRLSFTRFRGSAWRMQFAMPIRSGHCRVAG